MSKPKRPKGGSADPSLPQRDQRFNELLDLAREGNAEAIADLWKEYGFDFEREES